MIKMLSMLANIRQYKGIKCEIFVFRLLVKFLKSLLKIFFLILNFPVQKCLHLNRPLLYIIGITFG